MRILYCAIDQTMPGTTGGSVHVRAVAEGLAALGHEVHAVVRATGPLPAGPVTWHALGAPLGRPQLRLLRTPQIRALARRLRPSVVMERYYNFGGEGLVAARGAGALGVLEVNAPVVDYPGSPKAVLDRLMLIRPMERWRNRLVRQADLVVTPSAGILPDFVPADRVLELEWGADTDRFRPGRSGAAPFARQGDEVVVVFAGAFRAWHGASHLVRALRLLHARGHDRFRGLFVGGGPELAAVAADAAGDRRLTIVGPVPHADMPAYLAHADIGAAPFDTAAHPPLALGFYWSPLKIFEYMAAGLPVVTPDLPRLRQLVGDAGVFYPEGRVEALADALLVLADPACRGELARIARARAVERFSWHAHCTALADAMSARVSARREGVD
jgi:glycosyltransferase involved in cell wall biosynthesis